MVATLKIPLERRNKRIGRTEKARIWEVTDKCGVLLVTDMIEPAVLAAAERQGEAPSERGSTREQYLYIPLTLYA